MNNLRHGSRLKKMILVLILSLSLPAFAAEDQRGLLPDIRANTSNETENERRSLQTELLITKAETQAIQSLQNILKRKRGSEEEPDLLHRLAEMYMRRARTGRFLDLHMQSKTLKLSSFPLPPEKGADWIRKASGVYGEIEKRFPKYRELDSVLFNNAFANQQLAKIRDAETLYLRLIDKHPRSRLVPDAAVALAELAYDQRRFALALGHLEIAEKYPESRVYTYALYKAAWSHYNMRDSERGVQKLLDVVKACPADGGGSDVRNRQNLRREALRDLAVFVSDSRLPGELYPFFKRITTEEELGLSMMDLSRIYLAHGKFKDLNIFLDEFTRHHGRNPMRVKASLTLVDANESLKQRPQVLTALREAAQECRPGSAWRSAQTPDVVKESCHDAFAGKSNEIAAKWWEIWQKNKAHKEFSDLTEQALKIVLENEDTERPDLDSRFAYAELLFQLGRYDEASSQYAMTAGRMAAPSREPAQKTAPLAPAAAKKLHDADYGALFALEKALAKTKTPLLEARRKELIQTYLDRHPKGDHAGEVKLRMAAILSDEGDLEGSRKWLETLIAGTAGRALQRKAEDIDLEILNTKKEFKNLAARAELYLKREQEAKRREDLKKIDLEASYAALQEDLKTLDKPEAAKRLRAFAARHEKTALAADALLQAAAIDFVEGRGLAAADAVEDLVRQAPDHAKLNDALREAAAKAAEAGDMIRAAGLLQKVADREPKNRAVHLEAAADFLLMENRAKEARSLYNLILPTAATGDRARLYTKLLEPFRDDPHSSEIARLESLVLSQNLEPFATRILTRRARAQFAAGRSTEAFEAARKIMSRDAPAELRAEARLIQAQILESEFIRQSVKSSKEDRLALVLSMKTEKLEKALTAALSVSKMTSDPKLLAEAFGGVDRCYGNFIESLEHLPLPASLSEADQKALRDELATLVGPVKQKRDENRKEIRKLASASSGSKDTRWDDLSGDASATPSVPSRWAFLRPYIPATWSDNPEELRRAQGKATCGPRQPDFAKCALAGQWDVAEKAARDLSQAKATRVRGLHHLALAAEGRGLSTKALWLLRLAEKESPNHPLINYEKGRLLAQIEGTAAASADFAELMDTSIRSTESGILRGFKAFSEGDYASAKALFSEFSLRELYDLNIGLLLSESLAQLGEPEKGLKLLTDLTAMGKTPDLLIQRGRLEEVYKFAPVTALEAYTEANRLAKEPAQREWLQRKIEYLKVNFKVGLNVTSGD